jgi:hypothetical protein
VLQVRGNLGVLAARFAVMLHLVITMSCSLSHRCVLQVRDNLGVLAARFAALNLDGGACHISR